MLNLQYWYQIVNCGSVYILNERMQDSIHDDDNNDDNNNNNKTFTANVTLIPCTLALLKNSSNIKPLVLEAFLLAPLLFFFFSLAHCIRKTRLPRVQELMSLVLQRANAIFMLHICFCYSEFMSGEKPAYFTFIT